MRRKTSSGLISGVFLGALMVNHRVRIKKYLRRSHLEAIGRVAATWSRLEVHVLMSISDISGIDFDKTVLLCAPTGFFNWMEFLSTLIKDSAQHSWKLPKFKPLRKRIESLYTDRNSVVHAFWMTPKMPLGLLGGLMAKSMYLEVPPQEKVTGFGIPKRGSIKLVEKTAADIRRIAREIQAADKDLLLLIDRPPPKRKTGLIARAARGNTSPRTKTNTPRNLLAPSYPSKSRSTGP